MYKNILVADDIRMNRTLVIDILRHKFENINFFEAKTGIEALEIIRNNDIDLIVLDLIMPDMDGYEVLDHLNGSVYSDIPVIISSAVSDIESIEQTLINGANDYFTKPLSVNDINIILPLKVKNLLTLYEQKKIITKLNENISKELDMAIKFQTIMLPKSMETEDISVSIDFNQSNKIGGDFFDYVKLDDKYWFIISDVSKCGIVAGITTTMLKMLFRTAVKAGENDPSKILKMIDDNILEFLYFENHGEAKCCLNFENFVGVLENNIFSYANKGHTFPVFYKFRDEKIDILNSLESQIKVSSNDIIILYTDGIFPSETFDELSMAESVKEYVKNNLISLKKSEEVFLKDMFYFFDMMKDMGKNDDEDYADDVTIMAIKVK